MWWHLSKMHLLFWYMWRGSYNCFIVHCSSIILINRYSLAWDKRQHFYDAVVPFVNGLCHFWDTSKVFDLLLVLLNKVIIIESVIATQWSNPVQWLSKHEDWQSSDFLNIKTFKNTITNLYKDELANVFDPDNPCSWGLAHNCGCHWQQ